MYVDINGIAWIRYCLPPAACEVLIGTTGNHLFCQDKFDAVEIRKKSVR